MDQQKRNEKDRDRAFDVIAEREKPQMLASNYPLLLRNSCVRNQVWHDVVQPIVAVRPR